jgi:hypothetical protein
MGSFFNQGDSPFCTLYAFLGAMELHCLEKYNVVLCVAELVPLVVRLSDTMLFAGFDPIVPFRFFQSDPRACLVWDTARTVYAFELRDVQQHHAWEPLLAARRDGRRATVLVVFDDGDPHTVFVRHAAHTSNLVAQNSWGPRAPLLHVVGRDDFREGITFTVRLRKVHQTAAGKGLSGMDFRRGKELGHFSGFSRKRKRKESRTVQ